MAQTARRELVSEIARLSRKYPGLRLCQLISGAIPVEELKQRGNDIFYIKDEQLRKWLLEFERKIDAASGQPD